MKKLAVRRGSESGINWKKLAVITLVLLAVTALLVWAAPRLALMLFLEMMYRL